MLVALVMLVMGGALWSLAEAQRREDRLRAGAPVWADLARITGVADHQALLRMPGVSIAGDGSLRFNPAHRRALPVHLAGALIDHPIGHGLSLSLTVAAFGTALGRAGPSSAVWLPLATAAAYQLLARLYLLALWIEARDAG